MSTIRQDKAAALIRRELASLFQQNMNSVFHGMMITVTSTRMSPDLGLAKVYLSIYPPARKAEGMKIVEDKNHYLRGLLGKAIGKQLRIVPELSFYLDDSLDYYEEINRLLGK